LIYHPSETVFLRHAKQTGHQTQNGQAMILCQAVIAFCRHICKQHLIESAKADIDTYRTVSEVMAANW
jgi:shikimate 5-dehydrogenase